MVDPVYTEAVGMATWEPDRRPKREFTYLTEMVIFSKFFYGFSVMSDNQVVFKSTVRCPNCGFEKEEQMPAQACLITYICQRCAAVLQPQQGDCCIFCSFGSQPCPPMQGAVE
jgi:hypothetical protein